MADQAKKASKKPKSVSKKIPAKAKKVTKKQAKKAATKTAVKKPAAKKPSTKATPAKTTAQPFSDKTSYTPLNLFEYEDPPAGRYCLLLSDQHMVDVMDLFEAAGHEGGGYSWNGICTYLLKAQIPELANKIKTDPEAGMFVAYGTDLAALQKLAALLHKAFHDRALLTSLIQNLPKRR